MAVQTLDIEKLKFKTGNKYELLVILSKRARQIAAQEKLELDEKLQYFEGFEEEERFFQRRAGEHLQSLRKTSTRHSACYCGNAGRPNLLPTS